LVLMVVVAAFVFLWVFFLFLLTSPACGWIDNTMSEHATWGQQCDLVPSCRYLNLRDRNSRTLIGSQASCWPSQSVVYRKRNQEVSGVSVPACRAPDV
jgi:hypothetical protein